MQHIKCDNNGQMLQLLELKRANLGRGRISKRLLGGIKLVPAVFTKSYAANMALGYGRYLTKTIFIFYLKVIFN